MRASTLPTRACTGWCIGRTRVERRLPLKAPGFHPDMDPLGFEPRASSLQRRHSTTELWARRSHFDRSRRAIAPRPSVAVALVVHRCSVGTGTRTLERWAGAKLRSRSVEVIQPQIPLRLPCYDLSPLAEPRFDLGIQASSGPHSGALTGGVCKEQGRIRRALLTRDYYRIQLHEGEFQPSIRTTTGFRRLASPLGVASHCPGHCSPRVAQLIRGILTYRCPFLPPLWQRQSP